MEEIKSKNTAKVKELENKMKNAKQLREKELKDAEQGVTKAKKKMEESSKTMKQKHQVGWNFISTPNNETLQDSKLKAFADHNFFPFSSRLSKRFFLWVIKTQDWVVKG